MRHSPILLVLGLLSQIPFTQALSQGAGDNASARCITLSRIDRTEIIDDRHIAFYLRNGDIYVNRLNRRCQGLDRNRPFSYRSSTGQLCAVDVITVLENTTFGLSRGASCALGPFVPADEDEIETLKGGEDQTPVSVEPIEPDE